MTALSRLLGTPLAACAFACVFAFALGVPGAAAAAAQFRLNVPYVPTPQEVVDRMLALGKVRAGEYHMDLGAGDGRIAVTAASKYGARAFGVDLNPVRVTEARENAKKANVSHLVTFEVRNLYQTEIGKADIVTMYLLPAVNLDLRPRVLSEMWPGTRIVSHAFNMGDWEPDAHEGVNGRNIFLWIVPARVQGPWIVEGPHKFALHIEQTYQKIAGSAEIGGRSVLIRDASLNGAEIGFAVDIDGLPYRFQGIVNGDRIDGRRNEWRATRGK